MSLAVPVAALPRVNTPVRIAVAGVDADLASRVEDRRGQVVVVAAVPTPGRFERLRPDEVMTLLWAQPPRGMLSTGCVLLGREEQVVPLWVLRPFGPMRRLQRRRFARADVSGRVVVRPLGDLTAGAAGTDPASPWSAIGLLGDLSEGGARVVLGPEQKVPVEAGATVLVEIQIDGDPITAEARVVTHESLPAGRHQLRLQVELGHHDAGRVRLAVLRRQIEAHTREEQP